MQRCKWCNLDNPLYVAYHDEEWGRENFDDAYLYEMLILECFQAGLSWETILNKREAFREAFDGFDPRKVASYTETKVDELMGNKAIIRHRKKIEAAIKNSRVFLEIQREFESFYKYIRTFTGPNPIYEINKAKSPLSQEISKDLIKRGMSFTGPTVIYAFLQACGFIKSHERDCFLFMK